MRDSSSQQAFWQAQAEDAEIVSLSLGQVLESSAGNYPAQEAVVYACHTEVENVRWTYAQLNDSATRLAAALLDYGYQPGDKLAVWGPNNPEWILLEYALAKAGLVLVALNPLYKKAELEFALVTSDVKGIFHADAVNKQPLRPIIDQLQVDNLKHIHSFSSDIEQLLGSAPNDTPSVTVEPHSLFMIQYTSGTTGQPKAAQLSHQGIATMACQSYKIWGFGKGDRVCHGFPLFHVGGAGNSTPGAALVAATTLPLYIFKATRTLEILEQEKCNGFIGVPAMLIAMLEDPSMNSRDLSALRTIIIGGTSVSPELIQQCEDRFGVEIINSYGQTESSGVVTSTVALDTTKTKSTTSGKPLPGVSLKVVNKVGDIVETNCPGELCYQGPGTMLGYRNAEAGQNAIDEQGWLHTGDMATMDEEGYIKIVGRVKEMIIRGGENLSPAEIESFLLSHPHISEAAVIGLPDYKYGQEVCAVLLANTDTHPSESEIRDWCANNLSRWKVPKYIAFVDELPRTPSGKVRKYLLVKKMISHFKLTTNE